MAEVSPSTKAKNLYMYLTKGQRTLILIIGFMIIPAIFFASSNYINDGGRVGQSNLEVQILEVMQIDGQSNSQIYWLVGLYIDGEYRTNIMLSIDHSIDLELNSFSIGEFVFVKIQKTWGEYFAISDTMHLRQYNVLEIKDGLFWDKQYTILNIFFIINITFVSPIRRGIDKKLEMDERNPYSHPIMPQTDEISFTNIECGNCHQEFHSNQNYCHNCGSSLKRCIICFQKPMDHELIVVLRCCGSYAHKNHIQNWLKIKHRCPNCQMNKPKLARIIQTIR